MVCILQFNTLLSKNIMQIKGTYKHKYKVYEAIAQRLVYSFGFTLEQAYEEVKILVLGGYLVTEEYYKTVSRVGCSKVLNRKDRMEIWKHCKAIVDEANKEFQESLQSV